MKKRPAVRSPESTHRAAKPRRSHTTTTTLARNEELGPRKSEMRRSGRVSRRARTPPTAAIEFDAQSWPLKIYALGRFSVVKDGTPIRLHGKGQKKPLNLLKALISYGGRDISEEKLAETLWPDAEGDAAKASLKATLHRLRRLIGGKAIIVAEGKLTLDARRCWVDEWALERQITRLLEDPLAAIAEGRERQLLALYHGHFLQDDDSSYVINARERIRSKFLRAMERVGQGLCEGRACEAALLFYRKGLEVDPLAERFYRGLMKCCDCLQRPAEGLAAYEQCRQTLARELGVKPSAETEALARSLRKQ